MNASSERDYEEFEMLLGEIPNATLVAPQIQCPANSKRKLENSLMSSNSDSFANVYHSSQSPKQVSPFYNSMAYDRSPQLNTSKHPYDQKPHSEDSSSNGQNDHSKPKSSIDQNGGSLHNQQDLTSGFSNLRLKNDNKSMQNYSFLSDGQLQRCLGDPHLAIPMPSSPNHINCMSLVTPSLEPVNFSRPAVSSQLTGETNGNESDRSLKVNGVNGNKGNEQLTLDEFSIGERQQGPPIFSGALPFHHGARTTPFVPNVPLSGLEGFQQQYYMDAHSSPYIQPQSPYDHPNAAMQQLNRHQIAWRHLEEERVTRMQQQVAYLQQLQNQGTNQGSLNLDMGSFARNTRQSFCDMTLSPQMEHSNQSPFWGNGVVQGGVSPTDFTLMGGSHCRYYSQGLCGRGETCSFTHTQKQSQGSGRGCVSCALFPKDFQGVSMMDKEEKHLLPEKILTRSHGVNSIRAIKQNALMGKSSIMATDPWANAKAFANGVCLSTSISNGLSFQLDGQCPRGSSPEIVDHGLSLRYQNQLKFSSLDEVEGKILLVAKDQQGCRLLQKRFVEGTLEDVNKIFVEIIDHILELMVDPFGNYLVQKLLEVCNEDQRTAIVHRITAGEHIITTISVNMHGTRALQKVIETLRTREQISLFVSSIKPCLLNLINDLNGNHVVQRCLTVLSTPDSQFIFDTIAVHCKDISTHRHGCCVIQKSLSPEFGERRYPVVQRVAAHALELSQDAYGNYVVQCVLGLEIPWATLLLLEKLRGHLAMLSKQKFSSNVVEKCFSHVQDEQKRSLVRELLKHSPLLELLQDPYGNYVIQAALKFANVSLRDEILNAIKLHIPMLRSNPFGKRILASINSKK
ncbi:uncharacterized protein LOC18421435 [Amborella trichopoda]|nr:uncharacterized protein LOC18421435 [Amborella trichopoda]XP_020517476.1 uncharacterized protein LOC18421435 [Amborella trichopoda]|eukprot:XP_011622447.2 uncharacterized protein LOC18421435 [Amborella trichopoda]